MRPAASPGKGESPRAQAQVESRRAHSRVQPERRALGVWGLQHNNNFETTSLNVIAGTSNMAAYGYDRDGLITCVGVGSDCGSATSRSQSTIDTNGLLKRVVSGSIAQEFAASSFGELSAATVYSGRTYNTNGSVAQAGTELFALDFAATPRDKAGRIQEIVRKASGTEVARVSYSYDSVGRLWQESTPTESKSYAYDSRGNRLCELSSVTPRTVPPTASDCPDAWLYDARDRLRQAGDTHYSYTARGTLFEKLESSGTQTDYTYDLAGNLAEVRIDPASGPTKTLDYIIDASGRRVGKKLNGAFSKQYVWSNALRIEAELDPSGNIKSRFIYSRSPNSPELIVRKAAGQSDRVYRVISDQLGSPIFIVNLAQPSDVWLDATYDAWGNVKAFKLDGVDQGTSLANWPIPHGFAGGLLDVDTGLVRFGARDYDPVIGRWTARDPILFEGGQANLYVYVGNDPVNLVDRNGLGAEEVQFLIDAYRDASGSDYEAWDRAREDYRQVRLDGGNNDLRDAEHYLFRYWMASLGPLDGAFIPDAAFGIPLPMGPLVMEHVHDPIYNSIRPLLERLFNIAPTTSAMKDWEKKGYKDGYGIHADKMRQSFCK